MANGRPRSRSGSIIERANVIGPVLRVIGHTAGNRVIFKEGTGLSNGWNLIQFSKVMLCSRQPNCQRRLPLLWRPNAGCCASGHSQVRTRYGRVLNKSEVFCRCEQFNHVSRI